MHILSRGRPQLLLSRYPRPSSSSVTNVIGRGRIRPSLVPGRPPSWLRTSSVADAPGPPRPLAEAVPGSSSSLAVLVLGQGRPRSWTHPGVPPPHNAFLIVLVDGRSSAISSATRVHREGTCLLDLRASGLALVLVFSPRKHRSVVSIVGYVQRIQCRIHWFASPPPPRSALWRLAVERKRAIRHGSGGRRGVPFGPSTRTTGHPLPSRPAPAVPPFAPSVAAAGERGLRRRGHRRVVSPRSIPFFRFIGRQRVRPSGPLTRSPGESARRRQERTRTSPGRERPRRRRGGRAPSGGDLGEGTRAPLRRSTDRPTPPDATGDRARPPGPSLLPLPETRPPLRDGCA